MQISQQGGQHGVRIVGYNVQVTVNTRHHPIFTHDVMDFGSNRSQLALMANQANVTIGANTLDAVAHRGCFTGEEVLACEEAGITVTFKPMISGNWIKGRSLKPILAMSLKTISTSVWLTSDWRIDKQTRRRD